MAATNSDIRSRMAVLCHAGVIVEKKLGPILGSYLDQLVHTYMPRVGPPRRCKIYKSAQRQPNGVEIITLPREAIAKIQEKGYEVQIRLPPIRFFGNRITEAHAPPFPAIDFLYDDQQVIINHIHTQWRDLNSYGSACLNLRAGYGKTFIAAGVIALLRMRTLYIVPTCELAKQVQHDLQASLGTLSDEGSREAAQSIRIVIHYVSSGEEFRKVAESENNSLVCIAVINTVIGATWTELTPATCLANYFSLIIFDEVHTYCSPKRINIFWMAQTRYMFGMSATIGERRDGFDFALGHHLPPLIDAEHIEGFTYGAASPFQCRVRAVRYFARDEDAQNLRHETTDRVFAHYMYEQFAHDERRNALIVSQARELVVAGHNVFIFAEERAHVELLAGLLAADETTRQYPSVIFYGGVSDEDRRIAIARDEPSTDGTTAPAHPPARIIIATYSYSGTGISIIRMTALILATPRYSGMKQIVGRILRRGSDPTIQRIVIDVIDQKTCLAYQFRLRRNAYNFYGATYEKITVRAEPLQTQGAQPCVASTDAQPLQTQGALPPGESASSSAGPQ